MISLGRPTARFSACSLTMKLVAEVAELVGVARNARCADDQAFGEGKAISSCTLAAGGARTGRKRVEG